MRLDRDYSGAIDVWGEPTATTMAICQSTFERDGSVDGSVEDAYGGSAYATAIGCAHLGSDVSLSGPFGEDAYGDRLFEYAVSRGVAVSRMPAGRSRKTVIVVDTDGSRSMVTDLGGSFSLPYAEQAVLRPCATVLHLSLSSIVRDKTGAVESFVRRAAGEVALSIDAGSVGVITSYGAESLRALILDTSPLFVFANSDEHAALLSGLDEDLRGVTYVIAKHGAGATEITNTATSETIQVAVQPGARCVDTTGAGDAFAAGFLSAVVGGVTDIEAAVQQAHSYAAAVISTYGTVVPYEL